MAEVTKKARRGVKDTSDQARSQAEDATPDKGDNGASDGVSTITKELKDTFREAAIEVLRPVARKATTSAAKYAVTKGPGLVTDKVLPKLEDAGGIGGLASGIGDKVPGLGKNKKEGKEGKSPSGTGRGRRLPVEEFIDIGVDLETAYDQFTQFEEWPKFMHRVERIEQRDESTLMWHENIWGVRRSWEAEITDQTPCERLVWRSKNGPQSIGVVTFHRLSDNLTRILMTMDFQPKGLFEKTASGLRMSRRALKSDLMRFKAFVELRDEATGGWRGQIEDGEVVDDEQDEDELRDEEEPTASEADEEEYADEDEDQDEDVEEEPEASEEEPEEDEPEEDEPEALEDEEDEPEASEDEEDEPEASEDEEEEPVEEDEDEVEERPRRRRRRATASSR